MKVFITRSKHSVCLSYCCYCCFPPVPSPNSQEFCLCLPCPLCLLSISGAKLTLRHVFLIRRGSVSSSLSRPSVGQNFLQVVGTRIIPYRQKGPLAVFQGTGLLLSSVSGPQHSGTRTPPPAWTLYYKFCGKVQSLSLSVSLSLCLSAIREPTLISCSRFGSCFIIL